MLKRSKVIVLKSIPFSEFDLIIHALDQDGSKKHFIAKSAINSKKRFVAGVLEPLSFIELEYKSSKKSMHKIKQAWFLNNFRKVRKNYETLNLAFYFLKVISEISQEGSQDSKNLFDLLGNSLLSLETSTSLQKLKLFFQIKLLFVQGVLPENLYIEGILNERIKNHESFKVEEQRIFYLNEKADTVLNNYLSF